MYGDWADPTSVLIGGLLGSMLGLVAVLALIGMVRGALAGDHDDGAHDGGTP